MLIYEVRCKRRDFYGVWVLSGRKGGLRVGIWGLFLRYRVFYKIWLLYVEFWKIRFIMFFF